jgi:hypothetical protein
MTSPILTISTEEHGLIGVQFDRWDGPHAQYKWIVEVGGRVYEGSDLRMGASSMTNYAKALASLLGFLGAFAEAVSYSRSTDHISDNLDLFPGELQDWAYNVGSDQFSLLADDLGGDE